MTDQASPVTRQQWPYLPGTYLRRAAWRLTWWTVWRLLHWRLTGARGCAAMFRRTRRPGYGVACIGMDRDAVATYSR